MFYCILYRNHNTILFQTVRFGLCYHFFIDYRKKIHHWHSKNWQKGIKLIDYSSCVQKSSQQLILKLICEYYLLRHYI
jgi:hypothetical protein